MFCIGKDKSWWELHVNEFINITPHTPLVSQFSLDYFSQGIHNHLPPSYRLITVQFENSSLLWPLNTITPIFLIHVDSHSIIPWVSMFQITNHQRVHRHSPSSHWGCKAGHQGSTRKLRGWENKNNRSVVSWYLLSSLVDWPVSPGLNQCHENVSYFFYTVILFATFIFSCSRCAFLFWQLFFVIFFLFWIYFLVKKVINHISKPVNF